MAQRISGPRVAPAQKLLVKEQVTPDVTLQNPNATVDMAVEFMKKLVVISVSSIAFLRGIFPSDAFMERKLAGQRVYVMKGTADVPGTQTLIEWIKSGFDLVHSHHLKKLMLVIKKKNTTLEVYTFNFSYNHEEINCKVLGEIDGKEVLLEHSQGLPEDIAKSVRQTIRSILTHATTLYPLPNGCELSMKLFVDENVSEDLIPSFFKPSNEDLNFPAEVETLKLGKVETKFITFGVSSKTVVNELQETGTDEMNQEEQVAPVEDSDEMIPASASPNMFSQATSFLSQSKNKNPKIIKDNGNNTNSTNLSEKISLVSLQEKTVCCICECSDICDDTIKCSSCSTFQHKVCYKLLECHQVDAHICVGCHNPDHGKTCTAPELLHDKNRKEGALYRQALIFLSNNAKVSCKRLMTHLRIPRRMAEKMMQKLDADGCLESTINRGNIRNVKEGFKERVFSQYFSQTPNNSTHMETDDSASTVLFEMGGNLKRQLDEEKENTPTQQLLPQPKRRKILATVKNLMKPIV